MNKKGQALVEFVLILPVILIIIMSITSIGNLYLEKYKLNDVLDTCTTLYLNDKDDKLKAYVMEQNVSFKTADVGGLTEITVSKEVNISMPIYKKQVISVSKKVYKDE